MLQFTLCVTHDTCKALLLLEQLPGERQIKGNYLIAGKVGGSYIWRIRYFCCLAEFNLAVAQSETPYVWYDSYLAEFNLAVLSQIRQSAKLNSPPIFPAIRYIGQLKFGLASFCNRFGMCCMRFV